MQKRNEEMEITDSELLIKEATKLSKEIKVFKIVFLKQFKLRFRVPSTFERI